MDFSYEKYYVDQAGSGIGFYQGYPYQKGRGFWSFIRNNVLPFFHYIGKKTVDKGLESLNELSNDLVRDGVSFLQRGRGIKRKKKNKIDGNEENPNEIIKPKRKKRVGRKKKVYKKILKRSLVIKNKSKKIKKGKRKRKSKTKKYIKGQKLKSYKFL